MVTHEHRLADAIRRSDFHAFARWAFGILNPTTVWADNFHLEAITYQLQRVFFGQCRRLIITLPPRSLKSHLGSIALPAFALGLDPTKKMVCVSYGQHFAEKLAGDCRRLMESRRYRALFPHVHLVKSAADELATDAGGYRLATSTGGPLTGRGGSLLIIDDPLNASDAHSKASRDSLNQWYISSFVSRLDNPARDAIIIIMQRLHEDDLVGHLLSKVAHSWEVLNLPAIAQEDRKIQLGENRMHTWKAGELLHPERWSRAVLDKYKAELGTYHFNAQYLQAPRPETGNMLKVAWLKYFDQPLLPDPNDVIVQSWDTASKAADTNDYSVGLTFRVRNENEYYLIDVLRDRLEFPDLCRRVVAHANAHQASSVLIEDHGSGSSLVQMAGQLGVQGIVPIAHHRDKVTRMNDATPKIEAGALVIQREASWLSDFMDEYAAFPKCKFDDQMDALSQFLNWRVNKERCRFEWDFGFPTEFPGHEALAEYLLHLRYR